MIEAEPLVIACIPTCNEEKAIARVILQTRKYVERVVVCDDGSRDLTAEIAERLGADVVRHERNLGYGAAIQSLFKHAKKLDADVFVTLDADGQHDPSEIPLLVEPDLDGKADVVIGSRFLGDWGKRNSVQCSVGIISFHTDWIFHRFHRYNPLCHNKISRKNDEVVNETNFD